jgi:hypothetical protein
MSSVHLIAPLRKEETSRNPSLSNRAAAQPDLVVEEVLRQEDLVLGHWLALLERDLL